MAKANLLNHGRDIDCEYFLDRMRQNSLQNTKVVFFLIGLGMLVGLAAVSLNLGAVEITRLRIGNVEATIKSLVYVRLFLTIASIGCAVTLYYYYHREGAFTRAVRFLAEEEKFGKALLMIDFMKWYGETYHSKVFDFLRFVLKVLLTILLVFLPIYTFSLSISQN